MGVGECFGEVAIVDQGPRSADVIANQPTVLIKVSDAALKKMFAELSMQNELLKEALGRK